MLISTQFACKIFKNNIDRSIDDEGRVVLAASMPTNNSLFAIGGSNGTYWSPYFTVSPSFLLIIYPFPYRIPSRICSLLERGTSFASLWTKTRICNTGTRSELIIWRSYINKWLQQAQFTPLHHRQLCTGAEEITNFPLAIAQCNTLEYISIISRLLWMSLRILR